MRVYKNKDFEHEALRSIDDESESQEISSNSTIEQSNLTNVKYLELREKRAIYMLAFTALLCSLIIASTVLAIYFYHGNLVPSDANFSDDDVRTVGHSLMEQEGMCKLIVFIDYTLKSFMRSLSYLSSFTKCPYLYCRDLFGNRHKCFDSTDIAQIWAFVRKHIDRV